MLTAGEMLVGPSKVLFMDEISTGLDSSTTFQIIKCLRDFAHLRNATVLINLLQPPPEVYNLFDDVLLLSEGMCLKLQFSGVSAYKALPACYSPNLRSTTCLMMSSCYLKVCVLEALHLMRPEGAFICGMYSLCHATVNLIMSPQAMLLIGPIRCEADRVLYKKGYQIFYCNCMHDQTAFHFRLALSSIARML